MTLTIYTKSGRKISVGASQDLVTQITEHFKARVTDSVTLRESGTYGRMFTIPFDNIDYIEVS